MAVIPAVLRRGCSAGVRLSILLPMGRRSAGADLPLHGGQAPFWRAERMARLGRVVVEAIVHHYGRDEFLRRLAHPFWFQPFGAVMGMDWHPSGITTSVMGALLPERRAAGHMSGTGGSRIGRRLDPCRATASPAARCSGWGACVRCHAVAV